MDTVTAFGLVMLSLIGIGSIAMMVCNALDLIENRKLYREIKLKIKELKIKEIEMNR